MSSGNEQRHTICQPGPSDVLVCDESKMCGLILDARSRRCKRRSRKKRKGPDDRPVNSGRQHGVMRCGIDRVPTAFRQFDFSTEVWLSVAGVVPGKRPPPFCLSTAARSCYTQGSNIIKPTISRHAKLQCEKHEPHQLGDARGG